MTAAPPSAPNLPPQTRLGDKQRSAVESAAEQFIVNRIQESCQALWWAELIRHLLTLVLAGAVAVGLWIVLDHWVLSWPVFSQSDTLIRIAAFAFLSVTAVAYLAWKVYPLLGHTISPEYAARSLERSNPELRQALTSFITLRNQTGQAGLSQRVVQSIGSSTAKFLKQHDELPEEATGNMRLWVATAIAAAALIVYAAVSPKNSISSVRRLVTPTASIGQATRVSIDNVAPGDVSVIAGRGVEVSADIKGLREGESPTCEIDYVSGIKSYTLQRDDESLGNAFVGTVNLEPLASGTLPYRIVAGDATSPTFRFQVQDVPVVSLESVAYDPPAYTAIAPFTRSTGTISAVDGTGITLAASASRPVARAAIEFNPRPSGDSVVPTDGAIEMDVAPDGTSLSVKFPLRIDRRRSATVRRDSYRIRVWDQDGVGNPDPIIYPIKIIADLPPEVAIMLPTRVPKDVPIGTQQIIEVHASDADFGLRQIRLNMTSGIRTIGQPVLWRDETGVRGNQVAEYRFRPGELGLSPGDVVQITAIATDNRVDGVARAAKGKDAASGKDSESLTGNQTTTDPIELRIVATDPMPQDPAADSEGLSEPDEQPAADPDGHQESSEDGSAGEGSSSEGSGESGSSGQGEPQEGGGGEGSQSEQSSEESSEGGQQGSGGGSSDPSEGAQEQKQQGEGSSGDSQGQKDPSQNSPADDSPADDSPAGDPAEANPGENGGTNSGNPNGNPGEAQNASDPSATGQDGSGQEASDQKNPDQNGESNGDPTGQESGQENGGNDSKGNNAGQGETQGDASPQSGNPSEQPSEKPSDNPSQPAHDGEAFERIQDYLNQKKQQQDNNAKSGQSSESSQSPSDSASGESADNGSPSENPTPAPETGSQSESDDASQNKPSPESSSSDSPSGESAQDSSSQDSQPPSSEKDGDGKNSDSAAGDQSSEGQPQAGEQSKPGEPSKPGEETADASDPSGEGYSDASGGSGKPSSGDEAAQPKSPETTPQSRPGSGEGVGESSDDAAADNTTPPQAANDQYARKATDMVLDYLDRTRDQPDPELLERLNWTEQDLQRFQDRWKDVRDLDAAQGAADAEQNQATMEALRSLGLRPPSTGQNRKAADNADSLKGIRDSGKRRRPPAAFRDAFDAFRREMGSQN